MDEAHRRAHGRQGNVALSYRPVRMQTLTNEVSVFPPKKRVY